jgi:hypothetical protein
MDVGKGVRLRPAELAKILAANGSASTTEAKIQADVEAGAPIGDDGTINLVSYVAWLIREHGRHGA